MANRLCAIYFVSHRFIMTHYRLYNHNTGQVLYLLSISNDPDVNHEERLEKKKVEIGYSKGIDYNDMSWETLPS